MRISVRVRVDGFKNRSVVEEIPTDKRIEWPSATGSRVVVVVPSILASELQCVIAADPRHGVTNINLSFANDARGVFGPISTVTETIRRQETLDFNSRYAEIDIWI